MAGSSLWCSLRICSSAGAPHVLQAFRVIVRPPGSAIVGFAPQPRPVQRLAFGPLDLPHEGRALAALGLPAPLRVAARAPRGRLLRVNEHRRVAVRALERVGLDLRPDRHRDDVVPVGAAHWEKAPTPRPGPAPRTLTRSWSI